MQWWLEERQLVVVSREVKTGAVCQYVGSSAPSVNSQRSLSVLICCAGLWQRQLMVGCELLESM